MRSKARHYCRPHRADDIDGFRVVCLPLEAKPTQVAIRGGSHAQLNYSWYLSAWCRSAYAYDDIGFRVACLPPT
jgi:hypothetical protein